MSAIEKSGYAESTNFVICSDHGHLAVERQVNLNVILREHGFYYHGRQGRDCA